MSVLIIGNSSVYEVKTFRAVADFLEADGHSCFLFKQDKFLEGNLLTYQIDSRRSRHTVTIDGVEHDIRDFSAIWYLKPHLSREFLESQAPELRHFIEAQFRQMLRILWTQFCDKKWLNDPWKMHLAEDKVLQLEVARQLKIQIPKTIVTSDPVKVRQFYDQHPNGIIVKLLATSPLFDRVIYTNVVTPKYLEKVGSVKKSPAIFQEKVEKLFELRITMVGKEIFAARILSQEDSGTLVDWRRKPKLNDFSVRMEPAIIPDQVKNRLLLLMEKLGLRFGCIDMIVTKNNDYVFLEVNPNGQWYFVQLKTGMQIARAIANVLK